MKTRIGNVDYGVDGAIAVVTIQRPAVRNCVDGETAANLAESFRRFDADESLSVAILTGAEGCFCAGADLKAVAKNRAFRGREGGQPGDDSGATNVLRVDGDGPLGPTRMLLSKPVIAAVEGFAVAGDWSWRSGAICGWRLGTRSLAFIVGVGGFPWWTGERFACPGSWVRAWPWT